LTHSFRGFNSWSVDPVAFESEPRQHIMVGARGRAKVLTSGLGQDKEQEEEVRVHSPL
jgi:hypothetical protein